MMIHAVLGNRAHPEYGVASIPFPISAEEYPRIIEMLEALEAGDVLKSDATSQSLSLRCRCSNAWRILTSMLMSWAISPSG
mgnify:CR=1 FL=1